MTIFNKHRLTLLGVALLFDVFELSVGSNVTFTSSPGSIRPLLTPTLTLECQLTDTAPGSSSGSLIGRDVSSAADLLVLTSIVIVQNGHQDVAKVTTATPPEAIANNSSNIHVDGAVTGQLGGVRGFLKVTWDYPQDDQVGEYSCEVNGVDSGGHAVTLTDETYVVKEAPSIDDLVWHIHNLTLKEKDQQNQLSNQQKEISTLKATIDDLKKNDTKIMDILSHTETGETTCSHSDTWPPYPPYPRQLSKSVSVKFSKPYPTAPTVFLALKFLDVATGKNTWFGFDLEHVDQNGFVFRCNAWYEADWLIDDMHVSWLSVPH